MKNKTFWIIYSCTATLLFSHFLLMYSPSFSHQFFMLFTIQKLNMHFLPSLLAPTWPKGPYHMIIKSSEKCYKCSRRQITVGKTKQDDSGVGLHYLKLVSAQLFSSSQIKAWEGSFGVISNKKSLCSVENLSCSFCFIGTLIYMKVWFIPRHLVWFSPVEEPGHSEVRWVKV